MYLLNNETAHEICQGSILLGIRKGSSSCYLCSEPAVETLPGGVHGMLNPELELCLGKYRPVNEGGIETVR